MIDGDNFQITYAKKGEFKELGNFPVLVLYDGETITKKNNNYTNFTFSKSDFSLNNLSTNTTTFKKTQELSSINIIRCLGILYKIQYIKYNEYIENCHINNVINILKEFYKRLIIPFYIPVLTLIPFILILKSKESINYFKIRTLTFLIGLGVIIFSETTIRLITEIHIQNFSLLLIPIIFILIFYFIYFNNFKFIRKK